MSLTAGDRLGPYEIVAPLGAGGMGEVYRARDPRIGRDVAIKVLPEDFAHDADRLARFRREAHVLGSLNHPHIAAIYGVEESSGVTALVLELVDGPTLADRITQGPIPLDEALPIARQIAEALEAAHECGIIHRDLKPTNIKLTANGSVKVLDFGLAKALEHETAQSGTMSPTLSLHATHAGIILGTAAYMSPEQARGRPVDKRTDIWAFGCVLYEMLTGRRTFEGEDASETMAFVITKEPDWKLLPSATSASVRKLLRRCLERNRTKRLADIADAKWEIDDAIADPPVTLAAVIPVAAPTSHLIALVSSGALLAALATTALAVWFLGVWSPDPQSPMRFAIIPSPAESLATANPDRPLHISPDGKYVVYIGRSGLLVRPIDRIEATPLGNAAGRNPFVSADSKWVGFFTNGEIRKTEISGGASISICKAASPRGASWAADNTIVFATVDPTIGLQRVPAGGGVPQTLTKPDQSRGEVDHLFPSVLPNGRGVLFTIITAGSIDNAQIAVFDFKTGTYKILIRGGSQPEFVEDGYLVYATSRTLRAVRFDPDRLEILGDPISVVDDIGIMATGAAAFSVSRSGILVYSPGSVVGYGGTRVLVWVDRQGREELLGAPPRGYFALRLSPDGSRVALDIRDQENDIWIWHFVNRTLTRLTFTPTLDQFPVWMPDNRRIVFSSSRSGDNNLYTQAADGTGTTERLTTSPSTQFAGSVAPDGKSLALIQNAPTSGNDIASVTLGSKDPPRLLVQTSAAEGPAEISPDGRWIAYEANESGQDEIYVRAFPDVNAGRWQVSPSGGQKAVWAHSGRELFYWDLAGNVMSVPIEAAPTFRFGTPVKLFQGRYHSAVQARSYDVTRDGKRFLMIKENQRPDTGSPGAPSMIVVVNWPEELRQKLAEK